VIAEVRFARLMAAAQFRADVLLAQPGATADTLSRDPIYRALSRRAGRVWDGCSHAVRRSVQRPGSRKGAR